MSRLSSFLLPTNYSLYRQIVQKLNRKGEYTLSELSEDVEFCETQLFDKNALFYIERKSPEDFAFTIAITADYWPIMLNQVQFFVNIALHHHQYCYPVVPKDNLPVTLNELLDPIVKKTNALVFH